MTMFHQYLLLQLFSLFWCLVLYLLLGIEAWNRLVCRHSFLGLGPLSAWLLTKVSSCLLVFLICLISLLKLKIRAVLGITHLELIVTSAHALVLLLLVHVVHGCTNWLLAGGTTLCHVSSLNFTFDVGVKGAFGLLRITLTGYLK
jgi:hypothetical protein